MARHRPSVIWPTRKIGVYPQAYVRTANEKEIWIDFFPVEGGEGGSIKIGRRDARLLARRINECLDQTLGRRP